MTADAATRDPLGDLLAENMNRRMDLAGLVGICAGSIRSAIRDLEMIRSPDLPVIWALAELRDALAHVEADPIGSKRGAW